MIARGYELIQSPLEWFITWDTCLSTSVLRKLNVSLGFFVTNPCPILEHSSSAVTIGLAYDKRDRPIFSRVSSLHCRIVASIDHALVRVMHVTLGSQ